MSKNFVASYLPKDSDQSYQKYLVRVKILPHKYSKIETSSSYKDNNKPDKFSK